MKLNIKRILFALLILAAISAPVFAQRTGSLSGSSSTPSKPSVTVLCDVANARVEIVSVYHKGSTPYTGRAPYTVQLDPGSYTVTVSAPGYASESQQVNLQSSTTLTFSLKSESRALTVTSNTYNAQVEIRGDQVSRAINGRAPYTVALPPGSYDIRVNASGYVSKVQRINLTSSTSINIDLEPENRILTVTSNIDNALVQIKGNAINGTITGRTSLSSELPPGLYTVRVNAPGYFALEKNIQINDSMTEYFELQPQAASLQVVIPQDILDRTQSNPTSQIMIFDNGREVTGSNIRLNPGQHTIRITSGGFAAQQTIRVKAGEVYKIELEFGFDLDKDD